MYSVRNFTCKMRNSYNWFYFGVAAAFVVVAVVCSDEWSLDSREDDEFNDLVKIFDSPRENGSVRFQWKDCGKKSYPVHVNNIILSPEKLKFPGNITFGFNGKLDMTVTAPLKLSLTVKQKWGFLWIKAPCKDQVGSCTYDNVCEILSKIDCPAILTKYGIPCHCPFAKGTYNLPPTTLYVNKPLPKIVDNSKVSVKAVLKQGSTTVACTQLQVSFK